MRPTYEIVLHALHNGTSVELGDHTYSMMKDGKVWMETFDKDGRVVGHFGTDNTLSFNAFLALCKKLPEAKVIEIGADSGLAEIRKDKQPKAKKETYKW